jgi:hypothetical protein
VVVANFTATYWRWGNNECQFSRPVWTLEPGMPAGVLATNTLIIPRFIFSIALFTDLWLRLIFYLYTYIRVLGRWSTPHELFLSGWRFWYVGYIREMHCSFVGRDTDFPDGDSSWILSLTPGNYRGVSCLRPQPFPLHLFQFIIHYLSLF